MIVALFIIWGIAGYLACRVAYNQGYKDQWDEIARDYICFHKSVKIKPLIVTVDYQAQSKHNHKHNHKHNQKHNQKNQSKKANKKLDKKIKI